jgi:hypothetical protein
MSRSADHILLEEIMIDKEVIEQARNTDILTFIEKHNGFTFAHQGGEYCCRQHPSLATKADRLSWYWHSKSVGGHGAIDYLTKIEGLPFREAVEAITGTTPIIAPPRPPQVPQKLKTLILPERKGIPIRLYDYLCKQRCIDGEVVGTLLNKDKFYEDKRGNVVFVGYDEYLKPRFVSLRGTYGDFRGDCTGSDKRYSFSISGFSERLYVFESPIDAMSHASIVKAKTGEWSQDSRLSLAGTSDTAMPFFLKQHTAVKEIIFCLDNDKAGFEASYDLARKYADKKYSVMIEPPVKKDFNDDLQILNELIKIAKARAKIRAKGDTVL